MESVVRAIDVGYGFTKFTSGKDDNGRYLCKSFASITAFASKKTLGAGVFKERDTVNVMLEGQEYEVGQDAILAASGWSSRNLDMRFVYSESYKVLMLGALKMMNVPKIDVLVLGAPVSNFDDVKDYLRRQYTGTIELDANTKVEVSRVIALPQPLGGYAWLGKEQGNYEKIKHQLNLIIDPGYFTLDWLVARGTIQLPDRCGSYPGGMSAVIRALAAEISKKTNVDMNSLIVMDNIDRYFYEGKPFTLMGKEYDLKQHAAASRQVVSRAIEALSTKVGNQSDIENIILVGGGAKLFASGVRKAFPHHAILSSESSSFSNVLGFAAIGEEFAKAGK